MKKKLMTVALALTFVLSVCMCDYATGLYVRAEGTTKTTGSDDGDPEEGGTGGTTTPPSGTTPPPSGTTPPPSGTTPPPSGSGSSNTGSDSNEVVGSTTSGQVITEDVLNGFRSDATITASVSGATFSTVVAADAATLISAANSLGGTAKIATMLDIHVPSGTTATFTVGVPNLVSGQSVTVLHLRSDGAVERLPVSAVSAGSVTFTMTSYSPVAVIINESSSTGTGSSSTDAGSSSTGTGSSSTDAGSSSTGTGASSTGTGSKAPQTGDATNMMLIMMIAAAGFAGVAISGKKKFSNK